MRRPRIEFERAAILTRPSRHSALASAAAERDPDAEARGLAGAVLFARRRLGEETEAVARALPVPELLMSAKLTTRVPKLDIRL